ncbi:MAG: hypothetical protein OXI01_24085 [Albidovulum sp.]|nr:hypothetical protein [Albidovulum sp.]
MVRPSARLALDRTETGIDIVETFHDERLAAIQYKFFAVERRIRKEDFDIFFSATGEIARFAGRKRTGNSPHEDASVAPVPDRRAGSVLRSPPGIAMSESFPDRRRFDRCRSSSAPPVAPPGTVRDSTDGEAAPKSRE